MQLASSTDAGLQSSVHHPKAASHPCSIPAFYLAIELLLFTLRARACYDYELLRNENLLVNIDLIFANIHFSHFAKYLDGIVMA
jgi:hypothetical protein